MIRHCLPGGAGCHHLGRNPESPFSTANGQSELDPRDETRYRRAGTVFLFGIAAALVLLVGIAVYAQAKFIELNRISEQYDHSLAVTTSADELLLKLVDAESGQRGYLLTGRREFLAPYVRVLPRVPGLLEEFESLASAESSHIERLENLRRLVSERTEIFRRTIELIDEGARDEAVAIVVQGRGKEVMDEIRATIGAIVAEEHERLEARFQRETRVRSAVGAVAGVGLLISILVVGSSLMALSIIRRGARQIAAAHKGITEILECTSDAFYQLDAQWRITCVNARAASFFRRSADQLLGRNLWKEFSLALGTPIERELRRVMSERSPREFEVQSQYWPDHWVELRVFPSGEGIAVFFRDVTERRRLEAQMSQAARMESVGRLAGGLAHDFNNLLTAILGCTEVAAGQLPPDHPARPPLEDVLAAGKRAASLTRQLLDFSRRQHVEPRVLNLNEVLKDSEGLIRRLFSDRMTLRIEPAAELWNVKADPTQIEQLILNLCNNARDAMPDGGRLAIETSNIRHDEGYAREHAGMKPGDYVMLAVTDTGVGMDKSIQEHIFEPFFTTKERGRGTGLGLASCYGIVKQSGGHIWAYSQPGRGATFKVCLPRCQESPSSSASATEAAKPVNLKGAESVLIVEDDPLVRAVAVRALESHGYKVMSAGSAAEALTAIEGMSGTVHLVVTDVILPDEGGRTLADRITQRWPEIRILFASGYIDNAIVHHGVLEARVMFLQKPYTPVGLARKVREVLDAPRI